MRHALRASHSLRASVLQHRHLQLLQHRQDWQQQRHVWCVQPCSILLPRVAASSLQFQSVGIRPFRHCCRISVGLQQGFKHLRYRENHHLIHRGHFCQRADTHTMHTHPHSGTYTHICAHTAAHNQVARTAYAKAQQALGGRGNVAVYNSLDAWMQLSTCPNVSRLPNVPRRRPVLHADLSQAAPTAHVFYVSPTTGDDANPGTDEAKPLKTLHRAQAMVRALSASERPGTIVNLLEGTYYLGSPDSSGTLVFTPADGGAFGRPVTWQAYPPGARVVVSGGMQLDCK